jgi:hypothetical protein
MYYVQKGEYHVTLPEDPKILYTTNLEGDIAVSFRGPNLAVLGRGLAEEQLGEIINLLNSEDPSSTIEIAINGGDDSTLSKKNVEMVLRQLNLLESNISISVLVNSTPHPDYYILSAGNTDHPILDAGDSS